MSVDVEAERPKFVAAMMADGKLYMSQHGPCAWPQYSYTDLFDGWLSAKRDAAKSAVPVQEMKS
jgi:hypothetical protein